MHDFLSAGVYSCELKRRTSYGLTVLSDDRKRSSKRRLPAIWGGYKCSKQTIYTMNWLSKLFSKKTNEQLVMKFSKEDNAWLVMKGYNILYIGNEPQCNAYMWNHISK